MNKDGVVQTKGTTRACKRQTGSLTLGHQVPTSDLAKITTRVNGRQEELVPMRHGDATFCIAEERLWRNQNRTKHLKEETIHKS